jgi:Helix-turn-helix domain of resolvase
VLARGSIQPIWLPENVSPVSGSSVASPSALAGYRGGVEVHRDHQVAVVGFAGEDVAGDVPFVEPLHDDHDRRALLVETVGHRFADEPDRLLALQVTLAGVYKGRPPSIEASRVRELKAQGMRPTDIAKALKISRASVYRVLGAAGG